MNRPDRHMIPRGLFLAVIVLLGGATPLVSVAGKAQPDDGDPAAALRLVVDGLSEPIYVTSAEDGSERLFVVEKSGVIRIVQHGRLLPEPFLDISDRVNSEGLERGMLGLVFHPDFARNGHLYITYVPVDGAWSLERHTVFSADPNRVDSASVTQLIFLPKENHYDGHYGGMLAFGPDGYLYASIGDGGGEYDPFSHAQNLETLPGSILRLDIDGAEPYGIPEDNPFVGDGQARPEIWLYGLRNPWRFSFDRETDDLYIGDVGHVDYEEVDYVPADTAGGMNYGWPEVEGLACSVAAPDCDASQFEAPIHAYTHRDGCTIVGGYVYRRHPASRLYGDYLFGDYCDGIIWSLVPGSDDEWNYEVLLETDFNISSFGEDAGGRLYLTDIAGGGVYEIVDPSLANAPVIERFSQPNIVTGGVSCQLDIIGSGFQQGALVAWDGVERETEWINDQRLRIAIDPDEASTSDLAEITVRNPDPNPVISNARAIDAHDGLIDDNALSEVWQRLDYPVVAGEADRSWTLGPEALTCPMLEPYSAAPGGERVVQYFAKGRLEITGVEADPASPSYVSQGLLATEMITGQVQLGDDVFEERLPANINLAGDAGDSNGPAYATFRAVLDEPAQSAGLVLQQVIDREGTITESPDLAGYEVVVAVVDDVTAHGIAQPFWELMNGSGPVWDGQDYIDAQLLENPFAVTGRPISEAYWTAIEVAGQQQDVLIQCFERRCLTYTPDNPEDWRVESGNAGQHYYGWRYE